MANILHYDIKSLAASMTPGVHALVAGELQTIIDEHIAAIKEEISKRIAHSVTLSVDRMLNDENIKLVIDCKVKVE